MDKIKIYSMHEKSGEPKNDMAYYRAETSRSIEDAEKYKAIETLKNLGLLIPVSERETYHGRAGDGRLFHIDPYFKNGGNDSGNWNVNSRPTLYTSDMATAQEFGDKRAQFDEKKSGEIHEIVTLDPDAVVLNSRFSRSGLADDDRQKFDAAMQQLMLPLLQATPIDFNNRNKIGEVKSALDFVAESQKSIVDRKDIGVIAGRSGLDEATAEGILGAINATQLIKYHPARIINALVGFEGREQKASLSIWGREDVPVNFEYVENWLRNINCVGVVQAITSGTVGRTIESISFFDLQRIQTKERADAFREAIGRKLGSLGMNRANEVGVEKYGPMSLLGLLDNPHVSPKKLVGAARGIGNYKEVFEADAGNWEGYTLQEHTETVLRNFDNNYADMVPVEMLKPIRLALIAHDIGKPIAARKGEKHRQHEYNAVYGKDFLMKAGVDSALADLLVAVAGRGSDLAFSYGKSKSSEDWQRLVAFARKTLGRFYVNESPTDEQAMGLIHVCRIINVCDGGAYTRGATTRIPRTNIFYRNARSFDDSFRPRVGLGGTDIIPKR